MKSFIRQHVAALRALIVFSLLLGVVFPIVVTGIGMLPGLSHKAKGSVLTVAGKVVGSSLIGQSFTDADGKAIDKYFQSRPSAANYDPTASGGSNLGPESVVDQPDKPSLLTQVCTRSKEVGEREGVDGSRPYCTADGVGAVLAVSRTGGATGAITKVVSVDQPCPATPFQQTYEGVKVSCRDGELDPKATIIPVRGDAPASPAVPADAVTASGSGLDRDISPAYAAIQIDRVARARGMSASQVRKLVDEHTTGRALGFMGEPAVNVVTLNAALDASER